MFLDAKCEDGYCLLRQTVVEHGKLSKERLRPSTSSILLSSVKTDLECGKFNMGVFPSGQRGQTVNLLSSTSVVRIHPLPPKQKTDQKVGFLFCGRKGEMRTTEGGVRRSSPKAAIGFWDCEVSSNADFSQPLGVVEKSRGAEYPPAPTKKSKSSDLDFFIHCESNGISSTIALLSLYLISPSELYIITQSVYQKTFAMMIYKTSF